ncbi:UNVERIFIED_CONTAM: putative F-box protein [Sesamum radiatum]|uniref:F-box protein n=1 Tax=Sesamum radiatum TaxID=300843 RepID=A0AAW2LBA7_SESRA
MNSPPPSAAEAGFSTLHPDIIESHILTRLDGPALASAACCSTTLRRGSSLDNLWSSICHSTWPSTASPSVSQVVSTFPDGGPRAFFSHAFPLLAEANTLVLSSSAPPTELLSAVDIHHRGQLIFTKLQKTETDKDWFRRLPFRIDLLEPKDVVPTPITYPVGDGACAEILEGMTLSWILIDPIGRRAANLSSHKPVTVQRHWITGEVQARFASILAADYGHVQCGIVVTWGRSEGGVREVSLEMEDMDGMHLNGKDSLVILQGAMEGKKGTGKKTVEEGQRRYREYAEMKGERRERKLRREGALDFICMAFGIFINAAFWCYFFCR